MDNADTGVVTRILIALGGLLLATSAAIAADLPTAAPIPQVWVPPPFSWTGIYFGGNVGWSFAHANDTATITGSALGSATATGSGSANGAVAGAQIGFNYQINAFVIGLEGDFDWSGLSDTNTIGFLSETSKIQWLATVRVRTGFAIDRAMVYGTGGVAFLDLSDSVNAAGFGTLFSASTVSTGWTAGAGVEFALAQNWTAKVEYLYVRSNFTLSAPIAIVGGNGSLTGTLSDNIVRAGFNYKFP